MRKAVFFDIDGTLWDEKMQIPQSTKEALKRLRENGHYAFLCSGRSRSNIRSPRLLELGFDGVVAACGTHIDFHKETGKEEHVHTPPFFNFSAFLQQPANLTPDLLRQHDPGILFQPSI